MTVVGTRPHFVKSAMICRALRREPRIEEVLVHTGQHYDYELSGSFFEQLQLPAPHYNLGVGSARPAIQLANIIAALDQLILVERPDLLMVYGDTNSTTAGAIAAAMNQVPLVHVEAGLREFDKTIPEEVNKLLTDAVTDIYCCPTQTGVDNLRRAGITKGVHLTGDVGIDLVMAMLPQIKNNQQYLSEYGLRPGQYYLMTCHRAANTNTPAPLRAILGAAAALEAPVLLPIHPRTQRAVGDFGLTRFLDAPNLIVVPPLPFLELQTVLYHAKAVITDSGGIIKEAYFHKTPAIIIDRQTEWVETVEEGWHQITGPDQPGILQAVRNIRIPSIHTNCLGDGRAAERIVEIIKTYIQINEPAAIESGIPSDVMG